jgi:hypothetical protein
VKSSENKAKQRKLESYLTFSDASTLLGSGNHTRITQLVKKGALQAYILPLTPKLRVLKSDVLRLAQPTF